MRFYFDIPDDEFYQEDGIDFKEYIKTGVIDSIAGDIMSSTMGDNWYSAAFKQIQEIIKNHQKEICDSVAERVAEKIEKKKTLVDMTPKASAIAAINKENEAYFIELIDKAIAKRFK